MPMHLLLRSMLSAVSLSLLGDGCGVCSSIKANSLVIQESVCQRTRSQFPSLIFALEVRFNYPFTHSTNGA